MGVKERQQAVLEEKKKILKEFEEKKLSPVEEEALKNYFISVNKHKTDNGYLFYIAIALSVKNLNRNWKSSSVVKILTFVTPLAIVYCFNLKSRTIFNIENSELNKQFERISHIKL
jgi:hypothetical protein